MVIILFGNWEKSENNKIKNVIIPLSKLITYRTKLEENQKDNCSDEKLSKTKSKTRKNVFFLKQKLFTLPTSSVTPSFHY